MDLDEYNASLIGMVARRWAWFTTRTIEFNKLVRDSLSLLGPTLQVQELLGRVTKTATDEQRRQWYRTTMHAKSEIDSEFAMLNGQILMAVWGGFESFVEDYCRATLIMDRSLLAGDAFKNIKVDPSLLLAGDEEQADQILREAYNKTKADLKIGVGKFETQLDLVGLGVNSRVTGTLRDRIFYAQQFRNLIAHKGGIADSRFVDRCSGHGYSVGDPVQIGSALLRESLAGLIAYGMVIVNADRERYGLRLFRWPLLTEDPELESPYKEDWGHIPRRQAWFATELPLFSQIEL